MSDLKVEENRTSLQGIYVRLNALICRICTINVERLEEN